MDSRTEGREVAGGAGEARLTVRARAGGRWLPALRRTACVLLAAQCAAAVEARDWHVRTDGNDSGDGSVSAPLASLRRALQLAQPGDVVQIHAGSYFETAGASASRLASAGAEIVVQGYAGARPVLDASLMPEDTNFITVGGSHYVFRGLELRNARRTTFSVWGGQDIRIEDCWIHHGWRGALYPGNGAASIQFLGNRVWRNVQINNPVAASGGWPSAVNLAGEGHLAAGNWIHENFGEGIGVYGRNHAVRDNRVHDNYSVDIYVNNVESSVVERNALIATGVPEFWRLGAPAVAISLANESAEDPIRLDLVRIVNNVVGGPRRRCLSQWNGYSGAPMNRVTVRGNTFACSAADVAWHLDPGTHTGSVFAGNLVWQRNPTQAVVRVSGSNGVAYDHNAWFGGNAMPAAAVQGPGDVLADPQLLAPDSGGVAGFAPGATSPLVDAAVAASIDEDHYALPRPWGSAPDLGAIEYRGPLLIDGFE